MQAQPLWQRLKHLVSFDQQCQVIDAHIQAISQSISKHITEHASHRAILDQQLQAEADAKECVKTVEAAISELDEQEAELKAQTGSLRDGKSYAAHQKQLAALARVREEQEETLISAWHNLELAKRHVAASMETVRANTIEHDALVATTNEKIAKYLVQKKEIASLEEAYLAELPEEWSQRYRALKGKIANPIVPIKQDLCGSCFYHILAPDLLRIKRNAILPCRNCYRYLYYDQDDAQAPETQVI